MSFIAMDAQREALRDLLDTYATSLTTVYGYTPRALKDEDLPAAWLVPGPATYDMEEYGGDQVVIDRDWTVRVAAQRAKIGDDLDAEKAMDAVFTDIPSTLATNQRVEVTESPDINRGIEIYLHEGNDDGMIAVIVNGEPYAGTEFTFGTRIIETVTPGGL